MAARPRIITARSIGLAFQNLFGDLGPEVDVTGHYSAGGRARTWQEAVARARSFHADHKAKGWGGIAYHFVIADDRALICARPTLLKGAHTAVHNTQNLGINCPGTTGDRPTSKQQQTYRWLLANAHTAALPQAHRTDRDLRQARLHGHKEWPDNARRRARASSSGCTRRASAGRSRSSRRPHRRPSRRHASRRCTAPLRPTTSISLPKRPSRHETWTRWRRSCPRPIRNSTTSSRTCSRGRTSAHAAPRRRRPAQSPRRR